jgi:hypothetical protein
VVPNWQTFSGVAAVAMTVMRASVGCIVNRIPEGFSRKSLTTTADAEASLSRIAYIGTRASAARGTGRGAARAEGGSLVNTLVATDAIAVAKNEELARIESRVIGACSFSRRFSPRATPTGTRWATSKVLLAMPPPCAPVFGNVPRALAYANPCSEWVGFPESPLGHVMAMLHHRRDWKAALTSSLKTSGSSQAAKCPPLSTSLK